MQVVVDVPEPFVEVLSGGADGLSRTILEEAVANAYREHRLTSEEVRRILGYDTRFAVESFLLKHQIFDYTVEDFNEDLETLERARAEQAAS